MADIELHRTHDLGLEGARAAAERMAEHLGRKFGLAGDWEGDTLRFQRTGVNGLLAISEKDLRLSVTLGLLLRAMKPSIETAVRQELDKLFAAQPATALKPAAAKAKKAPPPRKKGG
ncbi:MAG: polyhydroxyalkanoic acid system family protein [Usitatibacter sp.]